MKHFGKEIQRKVVQLESREKVHFWTYFSLVGSIGVLFIFPVILGTYLGWWLDGQYQGSQVSWTMSGILLGLGLGFYMVYLQVYKPLLEEKKVENNSREED